MINEDNLEYAQHNEKACKYLDKKPEFTDWVITTAFYSALHFVRYKIFPINIKLNSGKRLKISDFEHYFRINNPMDLSKHSLLSNLVEEKHPEIADDYNKLRDISWSARYSNYKYPRKISNDAKKRLEKIKNYCTR
ncbi:MAG: hypothetical protein ACQESQ_04890 [Bacteroidota bacterium]